MSIAARLFNAASAEASNTLSPTERGIIKRGAMQSLEKAVAAAMPQPGAPGSAMRHVTAPRKAPPDDRCC